MNEPKITRTWAEGMISGETPWPKDEDGYMLALCRRVSELEKALEDAIEVAWDGPSIPKGSPPLEKYSDWRKRIESECKAVAQRNHEPKPQ